MVKNPDLLPLVMKDDEVRALSEIAQEGDPEAAFKAYRRTAGETEARNVQTRMDMTAAERRAKAPWTTQDVPDDQQIVRFGGKDNNVSMHADDTYRGTHRAPRWTDDGTTASLDQLENIYPDDIYGPNAWRYYGHGNDKMDKAAVAELQKYRGRPNSQVTIYRAVPKNAPDEIADGDWVALLPDYVRDHGEGILGGDYKIIEKKVRAADLWTDANSPYEFGYAPKPSK
jgi:hypothetical protein